MYTLALIASLAGVPWASIPPWLQTEYRPVEPCVYQSHGYVTREPEWCREEAELRCLMAIWKVRGGDYLECKWEAK